MAADRLHPKARAIVDLAKNAPPLSTLTPAQARAMVTLLEPAPEPVGGVVERGIAGPGGVLRIRIYRPRVATAAALVYLHGGGWVIGSLDGADATCRILANRGNMCVVSVDYRLAPETKFPGPVEDAYAAVRWVADHAADLRLDPKRVAVGGSSAGGNLAAAAAIVARDRGGPQVAFQLLLVPATSMRTGSASHLEFAEGYGLTRDDMEWFGRAYVRDERDADDPLASVLLADPAGLPPALVITAECDPLRDDGEAYAMRLRSAGIAARSTRYAGMFHGFLGFPGQLDEAREAFDEAGKALREALGT